MTLVVATEPTSLVAVDDQCAAVEAWAETCSSVPELRDATNKLAAIDEYLIRTSVSGRSRVAAAMRRLEVRIGKLLGPSEVGANQHTQGGVQRDEPLSPQQRHAFREMAAHEDEVEAVIAESTDDKPASRRSVMDRIKNAKAKNPVPTGSGKSRAELDAKATKAKQMAAEGYTSRQIAAEIGISVEHMSAYRRRHDFEVPADAVIGRSRRVDSNRVVNESVQSLEGIVLGLALVDFDDLDPAQIDDWATSLTTSLRTLSKFSRRIKEMTQ